MNLNLNLNLNKLTINLYKLQLYHLGVTASYNVYGTGTRANNIWPELSLTSAGKNLATVFPRTPI